MKGSWAFNLRVSFEDFSPYTLNTNEHAGRTAPETSILTFKAKGFFAFY